MHKEKTTFKFIENESKVDLKVIESKMSKLNIIFDLNHKVFLNCHDL